LLGIAGIIAFVYTYTHRNRNPKITSIDQDDVEETGMNQEEGTPGARLGNIKEETLE
jgi:hypothetical protein